MLIFLQADDLIKLLTTEAQGLTVGMSDVIGRPILSDDISLIL